MKLIIISACLLVAYTLNMSGQDKNTTKNFTSLIENGQYTKALEVANQLLKTDSLNANLLYETGKLYQTTSQYQKSINVFEKLIKLDKSVKNYLALAKSCGLAGKTYEAINYYKKLLKIEPDNLAGLLNLAKIYKSNNHPREAYKLYDKLHQLDTLNAEYIRKMAKCKEAEDWQEALELLQKAYITDKSNLLVVLDLTRFYNKVREYDSTLTIVDKALLRYNNAGLLYVRKGDANYGKRHYYRSIPAYKKAIDLGMQSKYVTKRYGFSLFSIKKYEEAKQVLEPMIAKDTMDYRICIYLGNIYTELGNPDKGILFFNIATELLDPDPLVLQAIYSGLANSYNKKGEYYKQISMVKKRQALSPFSSPSNEYLLQIATIYENDIKNRKKALEYYTRYFNKIEDANWYPKQKKRNIQTKINRLKEDLHFER